MMSGASRALTRDITRDGDLSIRHNQLNFAETMQLRNITQGSQASAPRSAPLEAAMQLV
jgi:hypothetical protein